MSSFTLEMFEKIGIKIQIRATLIKLMKYMSKTLKYVYKSYMVIHPSIPLCYFSH